MEAKHTPGPWAITRSGSGEADSLLTRPDNGKPYIEHAHIDGPQRLNPQFKKGVAVVYLGDGWGPNGDCDGALAEQEANARLIAAAPCMLEALQRVIPWMGRLIADGGHLNCVAPNDAVGALAQAEAAIARATGRGE